MPSYVVDFGGWLYVEAADEDQAFSVANAELSRYLNDYEIVNVEEPDNA